MEGFVRNMVKNIRRFIIKLIELTTYSLKMMGKSVVLIDTPTHGNLGDHAIAMAEKQVIEGLIGKNRFVEVTALSFERCEKYLVKLIPESSDILVQGGGFLGTIWISEELRFRKILKSFPKNRIIVFPQTITFDMDSEEGRRFFEESYQVYSEHKNLIIFVRDEKSYNFMKNYMPDVRCELVPDVVMALRVNLSNFTRTGILMCMRSDIEKSLTDDMYKAMLDMAKCKYPTEIIQHTDTVIRRKILPSQRGYFVLNKLREISKAKLLITDRLHGMIFAALTGTPCIAVSNSNGKVKAVYKWIESLSYVRFIEDIEEFRQALEEIDLEIEYSYDYDLLEKYFSKLVNIFEK